MEWQDRHFDRINSAFEFDDRRKLKMEREMKGTEHWQEY